ncbi:MAG: DUF362 domain-containing protein [Caldisericaceae bacterium]
MSLVKVVEVNSYKKEIIENGLLELLNFTDLKTLKINTVSVVFDFPPPDASVLLALNNILKDNGVNKVIFGASNFNSDAFQEIYKKLLDHGIELHNFRDEPYIEFEIGNITKQNDHIRGYPLLYPEKAKEEKVLSRVNLGKPRTFKKVLLPYNIAESDYVIPVIKLKDSPISKIGGFVNALLYFIPTNLRSNVFIKALSGQFEDSLLDIFSAFKSKVLFGIVDGIQGELTGSELDKFNVLMASSDLLSLDAVISVIIGFRSSEITTNKLGSLYDLGDGLLKDIVIDGVDFEKIRKELVNRLKFSNAFKKNRVPKIVKNDDTISSIETLCPTGAIYKDKSGYSIDKFKCIKCNFCVEIAQKYFNF